MFTRALFLVICTLPVWMVLWPRQIRLAVLPLHMVGLTGPERHGLNGIMAQARQQWDHRVCWQPVRPPRGTLTHIRLKELAAGLGKVSSRRPDYLLSGSVEAIGEQWLIVWQLWPVDPPGPPALDVRLAPGQIPSAGRVMARSLDHLLRETLHPPAETRPAPETAAH